MTTSLQIRWRIVKPSTSNCQALQHADWQAAIAESETLGSFLCDAAGADESVLVAVNDPHRATRTRPALFALSRCAARLPSPPRFRAVVATGSHEFDADTQRSFMDEVFFNCGIDFCDVTWHSSTDEGSLTRVGRVRVNQVLAESNFVLPIGSVEPHYFAGVTGPHKTATIGLMARDDIESNHALAMRPEARIMALDGNPIFDDLAETVEAFEHAGKRLCAIAQVVCGDAVVDLAIGSPLVTVRELIPTVRRIFSHRVSQVVDLLWLKVPPPLGDSLYQADKAIKNNQRAVRDGGGIILEAPCEDGIGPDRFVRLLTKAPTHRETLLAVQEQGYRLGDHKAVHLRNLTDAALRNVRVAVVSEELHRRELAIEGIQIFESKKSAMDWLVKSVTGPLKDGLVVEEAGSVYVDCP